MTETRYALPYVSHLRVTKRPTQNFVPSGYQNQDGQDLYKQITDLPGIECEITPYMGSIKAPATQYKFPSKAFFEDVLAELNAAPVTEQTTRTIAQVQATIARQDIVWCESILAAGQLPSLNTLWEDVFSVALDEFGVWSEPSNGSSGIPLVVQEMQWDARIPADGAKSISLRTGLYKTKVVVVNGVTQTVPDYSVPPTITTLSFEDDTTRTQRLSFSTQLNNRIAQLVSEIAALPDGPSATRTQKESEVERLTIEKAQRDAVEIGSLSELLSNQSVMASLPTLLMSIIGVLKTQSWPTLDMAVVQERLAAVLSGMIPAPEPMSAPVPTPAPIPAPAPDLESDFDPELE